VQYICVATSATFFLLGIHFIIIELTIKECLQYQAIFFCLFAKWEKSLNFKMFIIGIFNVSQI